MIGGALVAVGFGGHYLYKRGKKAQQAQQARDQESFERGLRQGQSAKPSVVDNMPRQVTLGSDVPRGAGQTVSVAGAVPSNSVPANVPRFRTSTGDTYIIQQNPSTNMLETILLYDLLTRPFYHPGAYVYTGFGHSPYMYGTGGNVIINETIVTGGAHDHLVYNSEPYRAEVYETETVTTRSEVDVVRSDVVESQANSDWDSGVGSSSSQESSRVVSDVVEEDTFMSEETNKQSQSSSNGGSSFSDYVESSRSSDWSDSSSSSSSYSDSSYSSSDSSSSSGGSSDW